MKFATLCVTATALVLSACASQPTTSLAIQNINNEYEVMGLGKSQVIAKKMPLRQPIKPVAVKPRPF